MVFRSLKLGFCSFTTLACLLIRGKQICLNNLRKRLYRNLISKFRGNNSFQNRYYILCIKIKFK